MNVTINDFNNYINSSDDNLDLYSDQIYENCINFDIDNNSSLDGNVSVIRNDSFLFVGVHFPEDLAVPLYGYAIPVLLIVTTFANTVIVAVLAQRHMRTPTNIMLMSISLSDLFTLVFPAPFFFYMYSIGHYQFPVYPVSVCYCWIYFSDIIPNIFHTASIWLTLGLAVQRYIYVCHAPIARVWCNIPRVKKSIIWIFVAAVLHQLPRYHEFIFEKACVIQNKQYYPACREHLAPWIRENQDIVYGIYFWFRLLFVHLGPCTLLVVLNLCLFRALRHAQKKRDQLLKEKRKSECNKLRDSNCTTMMLIIIVTVFLITEIPLAIITLLHLLTSFEIVHVFSPEDYDIVKKFFIISNFFIIFCYPINFAIYCGMSRQFRETFKELFLHGKVTLRREDSSRYSIVNGKTSETFL